MLTQTPSVAHAQPAAASSPVHGGPGPATPASGATPPTQKSLLTQSLAAKPPGGTAPQRTQASGPQGAVQEATPQRPVTQIETAMQAALARMHQASARQQATFDANNQSQLMANDLSQKGQLVGSLSSQMLESIKSLGETQKSSIKAQMDAFQKA